MELRNRVAAEVPVIRTDSSIRVWQARKHFRDPPASREVEVVTR